MSERTREERTQDILRAEKTHMSVSEWKMKAGYWLGGLALGCLSDNAPMSELPDSLFRLEINSVSRDSKEPPTGSRLTDRRWMMYERQEYESYDTHFEKGSMRPRKVTAIAIFAWGLNRAHRYLHLLICF